MSDVAVAPATSVPSAPPPAAAPSEVVVDQNQPHRPAPLGSQAPNKPVGPDFKGSEHRTESRRESIQKAFQRAAEAKPAEARMGHNNPPEPMQRERPKEKPKPEPLDLKKRPDDQPKADREPQPRAEHGHFAGRQSEQQRQAGQQQRPGGQQYVNPLPQGSPYRDPPQRMSDHAKREWHTAPESVRGEVHRMHNDFARAYQQYRGDHEVMNTIRPFAEMARQHGTTLDRALSNYVNMEAKLRNDPVGALDLIIDNLNLRADDGTPQGKKLSLLDVAWHIVNQTPEQRQLIQAQNAQNAQTHQLHQANARIAALETQNNQMQYAYRFGQTRGALDRYAETHPRLDELADLIEAEVKLGFDLDTAYRRAELLRPATRAAQTRTNGSTPAAQTRTQDRSISGAPGGGPMNGARRSAKASATTRDAVANAIRRVGGM